VSDFGNLINAISLARESATKSLCRMNSVDIAEGWISREMSIIPVYSVALRNATKAIGRSRRPRGPTYARGANRSQFEDPELAVNARHLAARRAHPAFKFFASLIPEAESFNLESFVPATTGGLEEHMLPPQMSG
jgi:hypothetical protein